VRSAVAALSEVLLVNQSLATATKNDVIRFLASTLRLKLEHAEARATVIFLCNFFIDVIRYVCTVLLHPSFHMSEHDFISILLALVCSDCAVDLLITLSKSFREEVIA
jgi:hypothetical protein